MTSGQVHAPAQVLALVLVPPPHTAPTMEGLAHSNDVPATPLCCCCSCSWRAFCSWRLRV